MGVTVKCRKTGKGYDLSYNGFRRFRERVAHLLNEEFGTHYAKLPSLAEKFAFDNGSDRCKLAFDEFDRETEKLIAKHKINKRAVNFLFQPDTDGKIPPSVCKIIYAVIKDYDDNICYGYAGRSDCAMFSDLKAVFKDCCDTNSCLIWR
ncbi:MAG: hypothetical protein HDT42_06185 [Ruminococcaceae bacterium]|nr:hypothetical protein [Oscillospiraceae bacterium]